MPYWEYGRHRNKRLRDTETKKAQGGGCHREVTKDEEKRQ